MNIFKYLIFEEASRADLYHAIKPEYAITSLENNKLDCHSTQRTWPGGIRMKDDQPGYNDSDWMRGLSLTRDIKYAQGWGGVVFIFDQVKLKTKYKIVPFNWGYLIGRGYKQGSNAKREREEFLITGVEKGPLNHNEFMKMLSKPMGSIEPLDKYLKGFSINPKYMDKSNYERLTEHPLFTGFFDIK
jgi:hypothetical protein